MTTKLRKLGKITEFTKFGTITENTEILLSYRNDGNLKKLPLNYENLVKLLN